MMFEQFNDVKKFNDVFESTSDVFKCKLDLFKSTRTGL